MTKFEKFSLWLMCLQLLAMIAIPFVVWKLLDPALEELKYKKEPVLTETFFTGFKNGRDYKFYNSNIGKFPIENVSLLLFKPSSKLTMPSQLCDKQSVNCVSTDPNVVASIKQAQPGSLPRIVLSNPIQGEHFVEITLHEVTGSEKLQPKEVGLTASVSSDSGPASAKCVVFVSAQDVGGEDLSDGPGC